MNMYLHSNESAGELGFKDSHESDPQHVDACRLSSSRGEVMGLAGLSSGSGSSRAAETLGLAGLSGLGTEGIASLAAAAATEVGCRLAFHPTATVASSYEVLEAFDVRPSSFLSSFFRSFFHSSFLTCFSPFFRSYRARS